MNRSQFALRAARLVENLLNTNVARRSGDQRLRAETSVGADYRAACRALSHAECRSKLGILEEECDESVH